MYRTCLFCTHDLGTNETIAHFHIGRRLAFDAAKGRLWIVCRHCERWNLTPLEERWEAIEECERAYRDSRLRVATHNVGLARLADGTELVRIGRPLRPELAAWRYGNQLRRRRTRAIVGGSAAGIALAGAVVAAPIAGVPLATLGAILGGAAYTVGMITVAGGGSFPVIGNRWLRDGDGQYLLVTANDLPSARMIALPEAQGGWAVRVGYRERRSDPAWKASDLLNIPGTHEATLTGDAALTAVRRILPLYNGRGAAPQMVQRAVDTLVQIGGDAPGDAFRGAAARLHEYGARQSFGDTGSLQHMPHEVRLALEMAANEDVERRAMEGELALLEEAWRDAEEVAAIADGMFLPPDVESAFSRLTKRLRR